MRTMLGLSAGEEQGEQPRAMQAREGKLGMKRMGGTGVYDKAGRPADGSCAIWCAGKKCVCYHRRTAQRRMAAP